MTTAAKTKLAEWIRLGIVLGSLLFGCVAGYATLRGDVERSKEDITKIETAARESQKIRTNLSTAVSNLAIEVKYLSKNIAKLELEKKE